MSVILKIVLFMECLKQLMWSFSHQWVLKFSFALSQILRYFLMKTTNLNKTPIYPLPRLDFNILFYLFSHISI